MSEDFIILPNPDFIHRKKIEELIKNNDGYCITQNKMIALNAYAKNLKIRILAGYVNVGNTIKY